MLRDKLWSLLEGRRHNYVVTFKNVTGEKVLADLARFCKCSPGQTTFHTDPRVHALLEGRREVFQRIINHLGLSPEELFDLYQNGKSPGE